MSISVTRLSGMASGLDTDTIVENLTYSDNLKISGAKQEKQLLEWKQQYYKEITDKLYSFQNKYFSTTGSVFDTMSKMSTVGFSSDYVSVSCSAASSSGSVYISDIQSLATGSKLQSTSGVTSALTLSADTSTLSSLSGKSMKVTLDGTQKTITFGNLAENTTQSAGDSLQGLLDNAFGAGKINVSVSGDSISLSATGSKIVLNDFGTEGSEASDILQFNDGASNRLNLTAKLSNSGLAVDPGDTIAFEINSIPFSFTSDDTLTTIMNKVNNSNAGVTMSYSSLSDKFTFTSTETGSNSTISFVDSGTFKNAILGAGISIGGTDAVVTMSTNGSTDAADLVTITRSSNTFEIDGTTYTLLKKASGTATEDISINLGVNTDELVTNIQSFVKDYNDLLSSINTKLSETRYKDYPPLTEEQEKDMTDDEITKWNAKAQSGLLKGDIYLKSIASSLRSSLYAAVSEVGGTDAISTTLTKIGISTGVYTDQGKLTVNETTLRNAINSDARGVINLFTQKSSISYSQYATDAQKETRYNESGLLWRINDIVKNNLAITGTKGALIELIGSPSNGYTGQTSYSKKLSDIDEDISDLEDLLKDHEERYYKRFSEMEAALTKLNSMGSWLSSMMSA